MAKPTTAPKSPESQTPPTSPQPSPALPVLTSYGAQYLGDGFYAVFRIETRGDKVVAQRLEKTNVDRLTALALMSDGATFETWGKR